jgi:hypothetical protein
MASQAKSLAELLGTLSARSAHGEKPQAEFQERLIEQLLANSPSSKLTAKERADLLRSRYETFFRPHTFSKGQLVKWKEGLKNRRLPLMGEVGIVMEVLAEAIVDTAENSASAYFREPLDIAIGIIDSSGDFAIFHYDSRRFEPFVS